MWEFDEFKEFEEFKRSQEPGGLGRRISSRGAALNRTPVTWRLSVRSPVASRKRESGRLPRITQRDALTPVSLLDKPTEQPNAGSFPGAACFSPVLAQQVIEQMSLVKWGMC
jgi:hypothetical protein